MAAAPQPVPTDTPGLAEFGIEIAISVGLLALAGAVMALVLLRLARHAPATLVTVSLAILTLAALFLYGATESEALLGVVGTGLGALAGAVTALFDRNHPKGDRDPRPRDRIWNQEDDDES